MIEAKGLTKVYSNRPALKPWLDWVVSKNRFMPADAKALDWLNFKVHDQEVFGIAGPEGGGKSTLLKILALLEKPTSGSIRIAGFEPKKPPQKPWTVLGYMPPAPQFFGGDDLETCLSRLAAAMEYPKGVWREKVVNEALEQTGLLAKKFDEIETLSESEKRWLHLAKAIMGERKILLLDEPFGNLGPRDCARMGRLFRVLAAQGKSVVVASRMVRELAVCCDRVGLLEDGKFSAIGEPKAILERLEAQHS